MSLLIDPNKSLIAIEFFYIEQKKPHGHSVFHFVNSAQELSEWRTKGYLFKDETRGLKSVTEVNDPPGAPVQKTYDPNKIIQKLVCSFKRLDNRETKSINSRCFKQIATQDGNFQLSLDTITLRDLKLKTALKKWDLIDDDGQPVPITDDVIDRLDPSVAQELLNAYERVTSIADDDLKK